MLVIPELKTKYLSYYADIIIKMTDTTSIYNRMLIKLNEQFDLWGLTEEKKAELISQTVMSLIAQFEQLAGNNARELITLEHDMVMKDEQSIELIRKTQYYDDRLLETVVEKQADLASFAVNANSTSAQNTINDLKTKMGAIESRVTPVLGNTYNVPNVIIAVPTGLAVAQTSSTTLTISWNAVTDATGYALYRDGIIIETTTLLTFLDTGLVTATAYDYNVRALGSGTYSDLSSTVIGTTL